MSTQQCRHCKAWYGRYRGDHPPAGYCSIPCFDDRKTKAPAPPTPAELLHAMLRHRRLYHQTTDLTYWFVCDECEAIEAQYSAALSEAA